MGFWTTAVLVAVSLAACGARTFVADDADPEALAAELAAFKFGARFAREHAPDVLKPVLFFPGLGGSELEAKLNRSHSVHVYCEKHTDWELLWLDLTEFASLDCFFSNLQLVYDSASDTYSSPGVEVRPVGFGTMDGVNYIDNQRGRRTLTTYLAPLTAAFQGLGYVPGQNLRAVTYDFRLPPTAQGAWFSDVAALIETMYHANNQTKVVLMGHSMGGPMSMFFLSTVSQEFKDLYIDSYVSLAAPFAGAPQIARTLVSGSNLGLVFFNISVVNAAKFAAVVRAWGGVVWMSPTPAAFDDDCMFEVTSTGECFSAAQLVELFTAANASDTAAIYETTLALHIGAGAPNVTAYCFIANGTATELSYVYTSLASQPVISYGDGDGTVPEQSLRVCEGWGALQSQPAYTQVFPGVTHSAMPVAPAVLQQLMAIATTVNDAE